MATYTSNYGWTKPSGSDQVNISVLNDNLDSQDSIMHDAFLNMAEPFSELSTYSVGRIVLYGTKTYKCRVPVTTPGSWTGATNWDEYKLSEGGGASGGEVKNLDNGMLSHSTDSSYITVNLDVALTAGKEYKITIRDPYYNYVDTKQIVWVPSAGVTFAGNGGGPYVISLTQTTVSLTSYSGQGWRDIYCDIISDFAVLDYSEAINKPSINNVTLSGNKTTSDLGIDKTAVGLGNVPNVTTDDQTPTFTMAQSRNNLVSGEKISVMLGKISKFFNDLKTVAFTANASDLNYDNTNSGLSATDVQGAVDELAEEKADKSNIAPDFSTSSNFQKKSLCWYEGKLYEFQEYHAAGAWTGTDVTEKNLSEVLSAYPWSLGDKAVTVIADGVKTYSQLLDQLYPYRQRLYRLEIDSTMFYPSTATRYGHVGGTSNDDINTRLIAIKETGSVYKSASINSTTGNVSVANLSTSVPENGVKIRLVKTFMS